MKELEKTSSVCPSCFQEGKIQKINAAIIEDEDKVWIIKHCKKHGSFKEIYFGDINLYKRWMKYKINSKPVYYIKTSLFEGTELYSEHTSQTMLTNLVITNRSNLKIDQNFFNAHIDGYVYEPSLEQLRELLQQSRNVKPLGSKSVQLTGGEPTLRDDLIDVIRMTKKIGFSHIQIHTNGLKLAESIDYCQKLKDEKVNSIYLSFNGVTNLANPLINYHKKVLENLKKVDLQVVLVSILIGNKNVYESGKIIRFALDNIDIVRGVHFQPVFFSRINSSLSTEQREKQRIDFIQMFDIIEKEFLNMISRDDFYPTSIIHNISQLIETLIKEPQVEFTPHPGCGGSTLIFLEDGNPLPITRFINIETLINFMNEESKKGGPLRKLRFASSLVKNIERFMNNNKAPNGFDLKQIAKDAAIGGSEYAMRQFHHKTLIIGAMWYQDVWNLNIDRLQRCVIHCPSFEGIVPFCSYIGLGYGENIQKKYSFSVNEWEKKTGRNLKDDIQKNVI
ncbi:MAG: hypothetical protein BV458_08040 [Thermoplasmata archaeon M9B2D]|nr:MAG: hypothetical protein BV458_08040 [Thermoplasmata archaeon M9B2D]